MNGVIAVEQPRLIPATITSEFVSIIVPARNEAELIENCLASLLAQSYPQSNFEILVVDGCSTDGTTQKVAAIASHDARVRLLKNPARSCPAGMNVGLCAGIGKVIIIAGAHTLYPPDFIRNCMACLKKTGADVVGGPVRTLSAHEGFGSKLCSAILSNPFGVGNSRFRTSSEEGYVDTVPFGAYRREIFDRVGLYNERLVRNQDNDLSSRIRQAGGKIYLTPTLTTDYIAVRGFRDLLKQAFFENQWHAVTIFENVRALGWRHVCPAVFVMILVLLLVLTSVTSLAGAALGAVVLIYSIAACWFALRDRAKSPPLVIAAMPFGCFLFHITYGLGTIAGLRLLFRSEPNPRLEKFCFVRRKEGSASEIDPSVSG
ncbi:MAG: glycosyltransferase family 2 protein [Blastocatellia bacterium]